MALFKGKKCFDFEVIREGEDKVLRVDCEQCTFPPSIEDSGICMAKIVDLLAETGGVTRIVLVQKMDYEYDYYQTQLLNELAGLYKKLSREERLSYSEVVVKSGCERYLRASYASMQYYVFTTIKEDPVAAYIQLKRLVRREKIRLESMVDRQSVRCVEYFVSLLDYIIGALEKIRIITLTKPYLIESSYPLLKNTNLI